MSAISRRAILVLKREGVLRGLLRVFHKLISPLVKFGSITFFVQDLDCKLPERRPALDMTMRQTLSIDFDALRECDRSLSNAVVRERFERGDVCFVAIDAQDKIAHSNWVSTTRGHIPELDRDLILRPREAYMYNTITRPDLRGCGLFADVRGFLVKRLHADGCKSLFFYVRGDNYIGLRAEGLRLRSPGKFWYLRVRGLRPLVIGRRSPELPSLIKSAAEGTIPVKGGLLTTWQRQRLTFRGGKDADAMHRKRAA